MAMLSIIWREIGWSHWVKFVRSMQYAIVCKSLLLGLGCDEELSGYLAAEFLASEVLCKL